MDIAVSNNETNIVASYWEMLRPLSMRAKLKLASLLTAAVLEEENEMELKSKSKRVARVLRRSSSTPTDSELEARFADKRIPNLPVSEPDWSLVINANTGKTIKPIEKWL